jgi:hypothetical protein
MGPITLILACLAVLSCGAVTADQTGADQARGRSAGRLIRLLAKA